MQRDEPDRVRAWNQTPFTTSLPDGEGLAEAQARILAFVATCVIATFIVSKRLTPIYESIATIDVDRQAPQGVMGQDALRKLHPIEKEFLLSPRRGVRW